jgi:PAS domain S-box-containing protein
LESTGTLDIRLLRISRLLERFSKGDFSSREPYNENGDEIDNIIRQLNLLGERVHRSGKIINDYEKRVTAIMDVLLKYTLFDFSEKAQISETGDEIDAIALALNTLGEELSDRIRTEKKHLQELEQMAVVMETTADALISYDPKGIVTHWNRSAERIYGYRAAEAIGKFTIGDLAPASELEAVKETEKKVRGGQQIIDLHTKRVRKDGRQIDVSLTLTPVFDSKKKLVAITGVSRDITEHKRAEMVLRESEARYRILVEGVKEYAIITLDPEGNITTWNDGAERIKGYKAEEILGKHFSVTYPEDFVKSGMPKKLLSEAAEKGKAYHEGFSIRKDKSQFWGSVLITALRDDNGELLGFSKITRDLTEYKNKDEEIRKTNLRLEQKNIELEKINKELASFAYVSSHDLQEPLRKIQTFASRIMETDSGKLSPQTGNYFERIRSSANRMQQLLQDILDYSRLSTQDLKIETTDVNRLVKEVLEDFQDAVETKRGRIEADEICNIPVIPFQFKQLITNLVSNAIKFSRKDVPPVVRINSSIIESASRKSKLPQTVSTYCHIRVSDNGIGFEPHFTDQIFEVFQRLHGQEAYPGTGIGLAICKKIVDNHNGVIEAESELGKGTTFHIYLPVK